MLINSNREHKVVVTTMLQLYVLYETPYLVNILFNTNLLVAVDELSKEHGKNRIN